MKAYNEDLVLTDYIWHSYQHLMTGAEKLALKVVLGEQKAASSSSTAIKEAVREHCGSSELEVVSLLSLVRMNFGALFVIVSFTSTAIK